MPEFAYTDLLPLGPDETPYRLLTTEGVSTVEAGGRTFLQVEPSALRLLAATAIRDIQHLLRPGHLQQLANILDDPEASPNDRFVALDLLKNANIAAGGVLPMCQDTGTAIVMGKRGQQVLTPGDDEVALSQGIYDAYTTLNLRYSQMAPLTMWEERNTGDNLPAQIELYADTARRARELLQVPVHGEGRRLGEQVLPVPGDQGGAQPRRHADASSTRSCAPSARRRARRTTWPSWSGGTSAEYALKTAKYASARYLDSLPTSGSAGGHAFRDLEMEAEVLAMTQEFGIGAQFGGKYFCHDVRVVRLPRHGASCPVAIAVSCSADRQALAKITPEGVFLEQLETEPAHYLPEVTDEHLDDDVVRIDLSRPMDEIRAELTEVPGQDAALAQRSARRRARHRARAHQGHARQRRADAGVPARPRRLLRRPGEDAGGHGVRLLRADDRGSHGRLRRPVPEGRRIARHAREGQPQQGGHPGVPGQRRLLPRVDRRPGGPPRPGLHQARRGHRLPRERHGSRVEDRGARTSPRSSWSTTRARTSSPRRSCRPSPASPSARPADRTTTANASARHQEVPGRT